MIVRSLNLWPEECQTIIQLSIINLIAPSLSGSHLVNANANGPTDARIPWPCGSRGCADILQSTSISVRVAQLQFIESNWSGSGERACHRSCSVRHGSAPPPRRGRVDAHHDDGSSQYWSQVIHRCVNTVIGPTPQLWSAPLAADNVSISPHHEIPWSTAAAARAFPLTPN